MKKRPVVVLMGGGSYGWSPMLMNDILQTDGLDGTEFRVLDINLEAGELLARLFRKLAEREGRDVRFEVTDDQAAAFRGADCVIITVTTGGLDAMAHDLAIPEKYGIYQTVGDTVGPGGWSRSLRDIPVFRQAARQLKELAPHAAILNYSNPLGALSNTLARESGLRTVGLCHGLFEVYSLLEGLFGLESEEEVRLSVAGVNHFFWILDFTIRGEPGYPLLRRKLRGKKNLAEIVGADYAYSIYRDERRRKRKATRSATANEYWVAGELFNAFGYLPYIGDRHTTEFLSCYLTGSKKRLAAYHLRRTTAAQRRKWREQARQRIVAMLNGSEPLPCKRSRETAADILAAVLTNRQFVDVVNVPNSGQIDNLPRGPVVETLGLINAIGFTPLAAGPLPPALLELVLPHAVNQQMIVEAAFTGNAEMAFHALANEPVCSHLPYSEIRRMGEALLEANRHCGFPPPFPPDRRARTVKRTG